MNSLDIAVIAIVALCAIIGFRRGLVLTLFRSISFALALFLAVRLQPVVARFLRDTFVYESIRGRIARTTNFENVFMDNAPSPGVGEAVRGSNIINDLSLPQAMRNLLHDNNTPDMFELLRVRTIEDYITGFFANIVINVLSLVIVFVLVLLILYFAGKVLKIVDMIPVVSSFNRVGGLAVGLLLGLGVVWLGLTIVTMFFSTGANNTLYGLLQGSAVARWVLDTGWLLPRVTTV